MQAKYISDTEIQLPTETDYLEDGSLKSPEDWLEYVPQEQPQDTSIFKSYRVKYTLVSEAFLGNTRKIIQTWIPVYFEPQGRVAQLNAGNLIFPHQNEFINGSLVMNYPTQPNSRKLADGWFLIEEVECPKDGNRYIQKGELIEDKDYGHKIRIVWEKEPSIVEPSFSISKKLLLDKVVALGKFETFMSIINSNAVIREYWLISVTLASNDTIVKSMIPSFVSALGMTEAQVMDLLKSCRSDI